MINAAYEKSIVLSGHRKRIFGTAKEVRESFSGEETIEIKSEKLVKIIK